MPGIGAMGLGHDLETRARSVELAEELNSLIGKELGDKVSQLLTENVNLILNDYSAFNALAALSFHAVYRGKEDNDLRELRAAFRRIADDNWGPAFRIVSGRSYEPHHIESFASAHVTRDLDNDIIMAQRGRKLRDGTLHTKLSGGDGQWLVLDYVILKALDRLWN